MAIRFNPLTGNFDFTGSGGGGGSSYIDGEVQNFSALPTSTPPAVDSAYLVREAEGTWLLARKPAGIYIRTDDTGVRADDWTHAGAFPDVFNDANFLLYDNGDSSKNLKFQLSGITTGTTRTITVPDANVTLGISSELNSQPDGAVNKFKLGLGGDSPTGRFVGVTTAIDPLIGVLSYDSVGDYDPADEVGSSQHGMTIGASSTGLFAQYLQGGELEATFNFPDRSGTIVVSDTSAGTGSDAVNNIVSLTQAEYNAIGSPNAATLFLITDP